MITKKYLLALGFQELGETDLPDWYNIFEEISQIEKSPAFTFSDGADDSRSVTIYLSPKGAIGEATEYIEPLSTNAYKRIATPEDVIDFIQTNLGCEIKWIPEE